MSDAAKVGSGGWFDARVADISGRSPPPPPPAKSAEKPPDCSNLGPRLTNTQLRDRGLGPKRRWHLCLAGVTKNHLGLPGVVCRCTGCGPGCASYRTGERSCDVQT